MTEVRSYTIKGEELPDVLKTAIAEAATHQSICRITHKDHRVAMVDAVWIPFIMKLVNERFKKGEINMLMRRLENTVSTKEASEVLANWAKGLV